MPTVKQAYVGTAHFIGDLVFSAAQRSQFARLPVGDWRRWLASLTAVYHTEHMVELDLPWWNVEATKAVDAFLATRESARVFEYGSGASSAWLAKRAAKVITVEHNAAWHDRLRTMLRGTDNIELIQRAFGPDYIGSIADYGDEPFDLIVVDGRCRSACFRKALDYLKPDGMILFDDSGRRAYRDAIETSGMTERLFAGRSFCVPYPDRTSLLTARAA